MGEFTIIERRISISVSSFSCKFCVCKLRRCKGVPLVRRGRFQRTGGVRRLIVTVSASTSYGRGLIRRFLGRAKTVLGRRRDFFRGIRVHVVRYSGRVRGSVPVAGLSRVKGCARRFSISKKCKASFQPMFSCMRGLEGDKRLGGLGKLVCFASKCKRCPGGPASCRAMFIFCKSSAPRGAFSKRPVGIPS